MNGPEGAAPIADAIAAQLAAYLGPNTARTAVKTFSLKALGRGPETLTPADVPMVADALRPVLRTFVGRVRAEIILQRIIKHTAREDGQ
jgi:hypothetical protein